MTFFLFLLLLPSLMQGQDGETRALMSNFTLLASYAIRPLSGLAWGLYAQRFGLLSSLNKVSYCMMLASLLVVFTPLASPLTLPLLLLSRSLQTIALAGEMPCALLLLRQQPSLTLALLLSSTALGAALACAISLLPILDYWRPILLISTLMLYLSMPDTVNPTQQRDCKQSWQGMGTLVIYAALIISFPMMGQLYCSQFIRHALLAFISVAIFYPLLQSRPLLLASLTLLSSALAQQSQQEWLICLAWQLSIALAFDHLCRLLPKDLSATRFANMYHSAFLLVSLSLFVLL